MSNTDKMLDMLITIREDIARMNEIQSRQEKEIDQVAVDTRIIKKELMGNGKPGVRSLLIEHEQKLKYLFNFDKEIRLKKIGFRYQLIITILSSLFGGGMVSLLYKILT